MKIEVINTPYPGSVPNGTVMKVTDDYGGGDLEAKIVGGDGFLWFMDAGTYKIIPDTKSEVSDTAKTTGTLAELNVKPGDVVENENGFRYKLALNKSGEWCDEEDDVEIIPGVQWHIISRNSDEPVFDPLEPPTFGELTDAQKCETVNMVGCVKYGFSDEPMADDTHRITFDTIDGKPDLDSIKMEEL